MMVSLSHKKRGHIRWDVLASASSVPNIHDKFAKPAGLRSAVMSLARVYITAFLLIFGTFCNTETTGRKKIKVNDSDSVERSVSDDLPNDTESAEQEQDSVEKIMPILPPIILLDFDNSTTSGDNATADEKSKRTVNNHLGYGFDRNILHASRKYNYYFPAGKTGTSVSIEESISPFLPRTIIEKVPSSSNRKPVPDSYTDLKSQPGSYEIRDSTRSNFQNPTSYQYYNPAAISQPVFGLRTKLMKTSDPERYLSFSSTTRPPAETYSNVDYRGGAYESTTPQSLVPNSAETEAGYVTPSPQSYTTFSSNRYVYVTPNPPSYAEVNSQRYLGQHAINVQGYTAQSSVESSTVNPIDTAAFLENIGVQSKVNSRDYIRPTLNTVESSTSAPGDASSYAENAGSFANMPRYTVEDGVRYENKIFWKYPDGRVSDTPPMTYETYSDYPSLEALQAARSQDASQIDESVSAKNGVLSQGPMQFPISPEPSGPPTPFISAETLSRLSQQQAYRLGYQNLVGQKQIVSQQARTGNGVSSTYSTTSSPLRSSIKSNGQNQKNRYETSRRPISKYMVSSPNPEYIDSYTTESAPRSTTPSRGFISSTRKNSAKKTNASGKNLDNYSNLQYGDLLNYNPSISQYIKNPASILNVRPTFVQAGNSLIPVIILRVDGVSPIQSNATPNVNLKALLQQYLLQYARSIEELARPTNFDFGRNQIPKEQPSFSTSPLQQLAQLIQNNNAQDLVGNPTESYVGRSSYEASNLDVEKSLSSVKYGERTAIRPKVKSVQIVEDPRLKNHRIKN